MKLYMDMVMMGMKLPSFPTFRASQLIILIQHSPGAKLSKHFPRSVVETVFEILTFTSMRAKLDRNEGVGCWLYGVNVKF